MPERNRKEPSFNCRLDVMLTLPSLKKPEVEDDVNRELRRVKLYSEPDRQQGPPQRVSVVSVTEHSDASD